jgi:LysM repeat protein
VSAGIQLSLVLKSQSKENLEVSNSIYQNLLEQLAAERGWSERDKAVFDRWKNNVGKIESNNTPDQLQYEGGPGRGKYQYEVRDNPRGKNGSGAAEQAVNRLEALIGEDLPGVSEEEKKELKKGVNADFSKISEDVQDALFLADKAQDANTKMSSLFSGDLSERDAWLKWHWKGLEKDKQSKIDLWSREIGDQQEDPSISTQETYTEEGALPDQEEDIQPQPQQTGDRTYVIKPGDNLTQISARERVAMEDIMRANGILDRNAIQAGQELIIPGSREEAAVEQEEEDPLTKVLEEAYDYGKSKIIGLFK